MDEQLVIDIDTFKQRYFILGIKLNNPFYYIVPRELFNKKILSVSNSTISKSELVNEINNITFPENYIVKMLPVFHSSWKDGIKNISYANDLHIKSVQTMVNHKRETFNEFPITYYMSKLTQHKFTNNFITLYDSFISNFYFKPKYQNFIETILLPTDHKIIHLMLLKENTSIPSEHIDIYYDNLKLIAFSLKHSLYIAYKILGFTHGDILFGTNYNILYKMIEAPGITHVSYTVREYFEGELKTVVYLFKLSEIGKIPTIILFDFGYSEINFKNYQAKTRVPKMDDRHEIIEIDTGIKHPIKLGSQMNSNIKRNMDLMGINEIISNTTTMFAGKPYIKIPKIVIKEKYAMNNDIKVNIYDTLSENNLLMDPDNNKEYGALIFTSSDEYNSYVAEHNINVMKYGETDPKRQENLLNDKLKLTFEQLEK